MTPPQSIRINHDLSDLRHHWDQAYKISYRPDEPEEAWHAERLDDHQILTAASSAALRDEILNDYTLRPVPRTDDPEQGT